MGITNKALDILRGLARPVEEYGTNEFPLPAVFAHVNVDGTYRFYSDKTHYTDRVVKEGMQYAGPFVKITTTGDAAVASGALVIRF